MSTERRIYGSWKRFLFLTPLLVTSSWVQAAPFDERIRAPQAVATAEQKQRTREYFDSYARLGSTTQDARIAQLRDRMAYEKWSNFNWRLHRTVDERIPIDDLSEFGLRKQEDGSYIVNVKEFPQWLPFDALLLMLRSPDAFDGHADKLKARGFRHQDVEVLRNYLDKNNYDAAVFAANKPLVESFAKTVQARTRAKAPIDREQVMSFVYQRTQNAEEACRQWAIGLLDSFDEQRQQILQSYITEAEVTHVFGAATRSLDELIKETVDPLISGEYLERMRRDSKSAIVHSGAYPGTSGGRRPRT